MLNLFLKLAHLVNISAKKYQETLKTVVIYAILASAILNAMNKLKIANFNINPDKLHSQ